MPRPGPRPYECVRRAWHSDRNQPMRGSIIQQILRVVHETHSPPTKKNKEWQEKLPIVVFRAEEIMYSKANSEAEYMNLDTLWDRVNDAINTIIRRDESSETGELLPPCVEAALNLGCIPVRASRSQRHSNPRTYLTPRPPESSLPPRMVDKSIDEQRPRSSPLHSTGQLSFARSTTNVNPALPVSESTFCAIGNNNHPPPRNYAFLPENISPRPNKMMKMDSSIPQKLDTVFPLYYGTQYQREDPQIKEDMNSTTIFVGKPVGTSIPSSSETGVFPNVVSFPGPDTASKRIISPDYGERRKRQNAAECDLSLRLGPSTDLCTSTDRGSASETEDAGSSSQEVEFSDLSSQKNKNKEFCFFPEKSSSGDPYGSCSSKWFTEGECQNIIRNPKPPLGASSEDVRFCWQPGFSPNWPTVPKPGPGP